MRFSGRVSVRPIDLYICYYILNLASAISVIHYVWENKLYYNEIVLIWHYVFFLNLYKHQIFHWFCNKVLSF